MKFLVFLLLIIFFISTYKKRKHKNEEEKTDTKSISVSKETQETKEVQDIGQTPSLNTVKDESKWNYDLLDTVLDGSILSYEYEENICLADNVIDKVSGNGGKELTFVPEPDNQYDDKAIAIYLDDLKIGYVYKGKIQNMLNDWIKRGDTYFGYINKIFVDDNKATYKIGFYKPVEKFINKTFSLVKTGKRIDEYISREDNLCSVSEGDEVTIEYDEELDSYVVFNEYYDEIGELPASAAEFIDDNSCDEIIGIVRTISENESGTPKVRIAVCLR